MNGPKKLYRLFFYPNANFILKFLKLVMKHKIVIVDTTMC